MADGEYSSSVAGLGALQPKPFEKKRTSKRICVFDTETDPFAVRRVVKPFTLGFYDGEIYVDFWGDDCVDQFFAYLAEHYEPDSLLIYAHNGGGFDFYFQLHHLDVDQTPFIMGGKIVSAKFGGQEFRDSFRIIPTKLGNYKKDEFDYQKNERDKREQYKREIRDYQKNDCIYLYELVAAFHEEFGDRLTIGSTALPMLQSFHGFRYMDAAMDELLRPYYYGGRTQCFETGLHEGEFKVYDVNSMYPSVMQNYQHPVSAVFQTRRAITDKTAFLCVEGFSSGAFPVRKDDGGLDFPNGFGRFWITIHEYRAAIETGTFRLSKVIHARDCLEWTTFEAFIKFFYEARLKAKEAGDAIRDLFYKLLMNSSYGKFAQNPSKYESFELRDIFDPPAREDCRLTCIDTECIEASHRRKGCSEKKWYNHTTNGDLQIWARKSPHAWRSYKNVAIASSITGAARSDLLRGIALADRPMYCDTDSLICEGFRGEVSDTVLGGWKLEATGDVVAIAGKKMYCVLSYDLSFNAKKGEPEWCNYKGRKMRVVKKASKGVRLSAEQIIALCMGETVLYENPVPKFNLSGGALFVDRNIKMTGD